MAAYSEHRSTKRRGDTPQKDKKDAPVAETKKVSAERMPKHLRRMPGEKK